MTKAIIAVVLALWGALIWHNVARADTVVVGSGGSIQTAYNSANNNDEILVTGGAEYSGFTANRSITVTLKTTNGFVVLTSGITVNSGSGLIIGNAAKLQFKVLSTSQFGITNNGILNIQSSELEPNSGTPNLVYSFDNYGTLIVSSSTIRRVGKLSMRSGSSYTITSSTLTNAYFYGFDLESNACGTTTVSDMTRDDPDNTAAFNVSSTCLTASGNTITNAYDGVIARVVGLQNVVNNIFTVRRYGVNNLSGSSVVIGSGNNFNGASNSGAVATPTSTPT